MSGSESETHWSGWIRQLADGDQAVAVEFWQQYGNRLQRLASNHLTSRLERRVGADDVVQSVCRTFFRRIQAGQFQLDDSEKLWRLLCAITLSKVRMKARFHLQQRRAVGKERTIEGGDSHPARQIASADPQPDEMVEFEEQLAKLLDGMESEEQRIVEFKLQQFTNREVADRVSCSERTVRRILQRVQLRLRRMIDDEQ